MRRYRSSDEDSARWDGFAFRDGDVVVSTRSKHGTTWVQHILLLFIHGDPRRTLPLVELSPWLDHLVEPRSAVVARLDAQDHRRVIKTHTPLDGVPLDPRATYVVVARHPLDAAVSLYHHRRNLDRDRVGELTGAPRRPARRERPLADWLRAWIAWDGDAADALDSLPGVLHHLSDAWRRRHDDNVVLVHYADLLADLDQGMRRLAGAIGVDVPQRRRENLIGAATLPAMRARATQLAPGPAGILRDPAAFFRVGGTGEGAALLTPDELDAYHARAARLAPPDLLTWLHR
ncbi:MAG TPA: sulfotransferase domain-containing protein [Euzebyales bacterium]